MFLDPFIDYEDEAAGLFRWSFKRDSVKIDNIVFFLHYKVTVSFLIAASILVTTGLYIGDPIECISDSSVQEVIDSFCWAVSTFTVPALWNASKDALELVPHPGVATSDPANTNIKFHGYYQWVCFVLFFQAMIFCIPRFCWKSWEGGKIQTLLYEAQKACVDDNSLSYFETPEEDKDFCEKHRVLQYFVDNMGNHNYYFGKLVFCEFLNLVLTVAQFFITNAFLGYEMTKFSFKDILYLLTVNDPLKREDLIAQTFPKVTKCTFNSYGPSGSIQNNDALCVLPFNVINEKIYLSLLVWLMILVVLTSLVLVFRMLLLVPQFRMTLLKQSTRHQEIQSFHPLRMNLKVGDWLILNQLSVNMNTIQFTELIKHLLNKLKEKD